MSQTVSDERAPTPERIEFLTPNRLKWDEAGHVRSAPATASEELQRNVSNLGRLVQPVHARDIDGELFVFDGWRRVQAADAADIPVATLIYDDLSDTVALVKSLKLNDKGAGIRKSVTDRDRERALVDYTTGERRQLGQFESRSDIHEARYRLGMDGDEERIAQWLKHADGVGPATVANLAEHFEEPDGLFNTTIEELQSIHGIGPTTASNIVEQLHHVQQ